MPQPKKAAKRSAKKPAAKKAAAKKKPAAKQAAKRQPEPEIQVNRVTETTEKPQQDPPLFEGTPNELDDNGETQADRDAAGDAWRDRTRSGANDLDQYEQVHEPLEHADFDHQSAEEKRQAELAAEREEHNRRTGDASR